MTEAASYEREYLLIWSIVVMGVLLFWFPALEDLLWAVSFVGSIPTGLGALTAAKEGRISIDTFNAFALAASFWYGDVLSAAFIVLMLSFARMLDVYSRSRTRNTLEELLRLKPEIALIETSHGTEEIQAALVKKGDTLVVQEGARVPVDGTVQFGSALVNESLVTGESVPVRKVVGEHVLCGTINESGLLKIRATGVGKDSTIERMVALVQEASKNKSRSERIADRFAALYLPLVLVLGISTYFFTRDVGMTAAIFLVACADDMAVAIPLAMTAALGHAAKRGVVIKGGEWIDALSRVTTLVVDKTGTLTYGAFEVRDVHIEPHLSEKDFWFAVAFGEKFSEHPIGKTLYKKALVYVTEAPDPDLFTPHKGSGVVASYRDITVAIGDLGILAESAHELSAVDLQRVREELERSDITKVAIICNKRLAGFVSVGDVPRPEARASIAKVQSIGVKDIRMITGDSPRIANSVASALGIGTVLASMTPEQKLREIESITSAGGLVAMVGDGVNDAAALARSDVGIAMGTGGAAVSVEAADIAIINDDLSRVPEMIELSRRTMSVIRWDIALWVVTNLVGFSLVFTGIIGPALAALYNFLSDFVPLLNSARLFRAVRPKDINQ